MKTLTNLSWSQARDLAKQGYLIWRDPWTGTRKIKRPRVGTREGNLWYHVPWSGSPASVVVSDQFTASEFLAHDWCCEVPDGTLTPDDGPDMPEGYIPICESDCNPLDIAVVGSGDVHLTVGRIVIDDNCGDVDGKMVCLLGSDIDGKKMEIWYGQAPIVAPAGGYMINRIALKSAGNTGNYYISAGKFYKKWSNEPTAAELSPGTVVMDNVELDGLIGGAKANIRVGIRSCVAFVNGERYFELTLVRPRVCDLPNLYGVYGLCFDYLTHGMLFSRFSGFDYDGISVIGGRIPGGAWTKAAISSTDAADYTGPKFSADSKTFGAACRTNRRLPIPDFLFPDDPFPVLKWWVELYNPQDDSSGGGVGEP